MWTIKNCLAAGCRRLPYTIPTRGQPRAQHIHRPSTRRRLAVHNVVLLRSGMTKILIHSPINDEYVKYFVQYLARSWVFFGHGYTFDANGPCSAAESRKTRVGSNAVRCADTCMILRARVDHLFHCGIKISNLYNYSLYICLLRIFNTKRPSSVTINRTKSLPLSRTTETVRFSFFVRFS